MSTEKKSSGLQREDFQGKSHQVKSNQDGLHPDLEKYVKKHLLSEWKRPIAPHNRIAFSELLLEIQNSLGIDSTELSKRDLIFDTGCGTGQSSRILGHKNPESIVIGVDKSEVRLEKYKNESKQKNSNVFICRCDLLDFWSLALEYRLFPRIHCFYYPNPWPKKAHIMRRWHGSPVFPLILKLGGQIELRSNWEIYVREFEASLFLAGQKPNVSEIFYTEGVQEYLTRFEQKYWLSGHKLYSLVCKIV